MHLRLFRCALFVTLAASIAAACNPSPSFQEEPPASSSPLAPSVISPTLAASCASPASRTIQPFLQISSEMSFPDICRLVGLPTKEIGSGLHIFLYFLEDGSTVTMGFSSLEEDSQAMYVWLARPDGTQQSLLE
jgi:hypothetical protein